MGDKLITIDDIEVRLDRPLSWGIANGTEEIHEGRLREKLYFVPKALEGVELAQDGKSITMPSWKARELGLI